jgi:hypothetical protein
MVMTCVHLPSRSLVHVDGVNGRVPCGKASLSGTHLAVVISSAAGELWYVIGASRAIGIYGAAKASRFPW